MKSTEKNIVEAFNLSTNANLIMCQFEYARYDAFNDNHIVEVKYRHKWYDDMLIEFDKYSFNLLYAHLSDKTFLYLVAHEEHILSFNITKLTQDKYDFKWEWRQMPTTTEFSINKNKPKFVGYLNVEEADLTLETTDLHAITTGTV